MFQKAASWIVGADLAMNLWPMTSVMVSAGRYAFFDKSAHVFNLIVLMNDFNNKLIPPIPRGVIMMGGGRDTQHSERRTIL